MLTKEILEKLTRWVLALGLLIAVVMSVAKSTVRDYYDLRHEIHQHAMTETQANNTNGAPR
jgi:hypothetical protein